MCRLLMFSKYIISCNVDYFLLENTDYIYNSSGKKYNILCICHHVLKLTITQKQEIITFHVMSSQTFTTQFCFDVNQMHFSFKKLLVQLNKIRYLVTFNLIQLKKYYQHSKCASIHGVNKLFKLN